MTAPIDTLEVVMKPRHLRNSHEICQVLSSLSLQVAQLRNLTIDTIEDLQNIQPQSQQARFDLLTIVFQDMVSLETLQFGPLDLYEKDEDHGVVLLGGDMVNLVAEKASRLKKLVIETQVTIREGYYITNLNNVFRRILKYYPNLEEIDLDFRTTNLMEHQPSVDFKLDFLAHSKIKLIKAKMEMCCRGDPFLNCYSFSSAPGRY